MPIPAEFEKTGFAEDFFGEDEEHAGRLEALKRVNPRDRRHLVEERMNQKESCVVCGSQWFEEITFNQYRAGTYSSTPGGSHEAISVMPMCILRCLCGHPVTPNVGGAVHGGRTPNESLASFDGSLQAAIRSRSEGPQKTLQKMLEDSMATVAAADDLQELANKMQEFERALGYVATNDSTKAEADVETPAAPAGKPAPAKKK